VAAEQTTRELEHEARKRVLVVEENPAEREHITSALGPYCTLTFASGAVEALSAVRGGGADVVVTELDLSDGDGLALCERLRALPQMEHLPIMVLTSRSRIEDKLAGFQAGADDYVVKPLDARLFYARVRFLCRIKKLETQSPRVPWLFDS
jgi:DNA-binding response OmpR family regulator